MENLPDEVLEFILSLISPYKDLHDCMLVSKRWRRCVLNVTKTKLRNLHKAISDFDVRWDNLAVGEIGPTISKRYSHSAIIHDNCMYVFGGCTSSMTTFNDLWKFDLSSRKWTRPLTLGEYPSPKACSSLVVYKDLLVLFGGWAYPASYPHYQSLHLFNELHVYDIIANRWTCQNTLFSPPPTAGHSVSVVGEWMIIFGGIDKPNMAVHCENSSSIWKLNLETWIWSEQEVENGPKPNGRLGQTQIVLNDQTLLIVGGSGGTALNYCDCWILHMNGKLWRWQQVEILGKSNKPNTIWTNPGCKIGDKIVVLNRIREDSANSVVYYPKKSWISNRTNRGQDVSKLARIDLANRLQDSDDNVNGKRGVLRNVQWGEEKAGCSVNTKNDKNNIKINNFPLNPNNNKMAAFNPTISKASRLREQRQAKLAEMQENLKKKRVEEKVHKGYYLGIYVLDLKTALDHKPTVTWLPPKVQDNGPEETILHTLLEGKSELIMFGGIKKDPSSLNYSVNVNHQISNSLHFITAPNYVI